MLMENCQTSFSFSDSISSQKLPKTRFTRSLYYFLLRSLIQKIFFLCMCKAKEKFWLSAYRCIIRGYCLSCQKCDNYVDLLEKILMYSTVLIVQLSYTISLKGLNMLNALIIQQISSIFHLIKPFNM